MLTGRRRVILMSLLALFLVACLALPTYACSSIIVGKNASATGEVLFGHNEDNGGRLVMPVYVVPRMRHGPGTMITFEEGRARIPQVEETGRLSGQRPVRPGAHPLAASSSTSGG